MHIAKKNPIISIKFTYSGTEENFSKFLQALVRDYLRADDPAAIPNTEIVETVESRLAWLF